MYNINLLHLEKLNYFDKEVKICQDKITEFKYILSKTEPKTDTSIIKARLGHYIQCKAELIKDRKKYYNDNIIIVAQYNIEKNYKKQQKLIEEYILNTNPILYYNEIYSNDKYKNIKCTNCKNTKKMQIIRPGHYRCPVCENTTIILSKNVLISDINLNSTYKNNNYQKITYFETFLNKLCCIKTPKNPEKIIKAIREYAIEYKIKEIYDADIVRHILKNIEIDGVKGSKYYQYTSYLVCMLNGTKLPSDISSEDRELILYLFKKVENVWSDMIDPEHKKSFFSYQYCMRKILELISIYDEYLPLIPLYNSIENINANDMIWKEICAKLKWQFLYTY